MSNKKYWLLPIQTKDEAFKIIKETSNAFLFLAGIQGVIGLFISLSMLIDSVIYLVLGLFLKYKKSRFVSILLLIISGLSIWMTFENKFNNSTTGGSNIYLATGVFIVAIKATEATFKLHGKFKSKNIT